MALNIDRFNFIQMFNNSKGKTSLMLFSSFIGVITSSLIFTLCGVIAAFMVMFEAKSTDISNVLTSLAMQSVGLFTVSIGALTTRRFTDDKTITNENKEI